MNRKIKNFPSENPFDFREYIETKKEENENDLSLFFELAKENRIIYSQTPVNTLIEDVKELRNGFFRMVF